MATYYMYFPFLTCEVKCGAAALDIADRQNAHSMTLAVRGIVELFRAVKREDEVNRGGLVSVAVWSRRVNCLTRTGPARLAKMRVESIGSLIST
jgi:hypothetical protein